MAETVRQHLKLIAVTASVLLLACTFTSNAFGQATSITSEGYNASHLGNQSDPTKVTTEWTTGNLGNTWAEGEWVPYQLTINNVQNSYPGLVGFPDIVMEYDFTAQNDARFVDMVRSIQVGTATLTDDQGWPRDDQTAYPMTTRPEIEAAQNDVGNTGSLENTWPGFTLLNLPNSQVNRATPPGYGDGTPSDQFRYFYITRQDLIDAGVPTNATTIVIYYQLHESRTFVWLNSLQEQYDQDPTDDWGGYLYSLPAFAADIREGSGYVPGSSGQLRVSFASGDKTVPIPIPEQLPGAVSGLKWLDQNGNGMMDGTETTLSGWRIYVEGTLEGIFFSASTLTDGSGDYSFPNLTSNVVWTISEDAQREVPAEIGYLQTYPMVGDMVGVGTGVAVPPQAGIADYGWDVALTLAVPDQGDMNFGNKLCELSITCPPDITVDCNESTDPEFTGYPTIDSNCPPNDTTYGDVIIPGDCDIDGYLYQIERTWEVTDYIGNVETCVQIITVTDTTAPTIVCPDPITVQCLDDVPAPDISLVDASDDCTEVTVTWEGDVSDGGTCPEIITRTYRATDECGNYAECTQIITVDDDTPPTIECPAPVTVQCIEDVPAPDPSSVTAGDNCDDDVEVTWVGDVSDGLTCPETITRTYQAEDDCGNTSTCTQIITVDDDTPPEITCPDPISVQCIDDVPDPDVLLVTATDNCDDDPVVTWVSDVSDGLTCPETITRTYQAEDDCGNTSTCTQIITVDDDTPPTIDCPGPISVQCYDDVPSPDPSSVTAGDNCDDDVEVTWVGDEPDGQTCPLTITRTYQAEDDCGNTTTCTQLITVNDDTPPEITCPGPISVQCIDDVPDPDASLVTATDNCDDDPVVTWVSDVSDGLTCPETITRTYQAEDDCGNVTTCTQIITVDDDTPPEITCPDPINVQCIDDVPDPDPSLVTALDNCDDNPVVTWVDDVSNGQTCPETITRTYRAEDDCGNVATCTQIITVDDDTPPEVTCPGDVNVECRADVPAPDPSLVTATDNCDDTPVISFVGDQSDGNTCPETITRTYQAEDDCGNIGYCSQTIIVHDITAPVLSGCPADIALACDEEVPAPAEVTATDNCGPVTVEFVEDTTLGDCMYNFTINRLWTVEDACGNADSCWQYITISDDEAPVLTCAPDDTVECDAPINFIEPTATDNCDENPSVTMVLDEMYEDPITGNIIYTRGWVATDVCGNESDTCYQNIVELPCPDLCTFTMGGWGSECPESQSGNMSSTQPGCVRDHYFLVAFPGGEVVIGHSSGYTVTWTGVAAIEAYLPAGGTPAVLTDHLVDPDPDETGVLVGQILALTLNRAYSCAGVFYDLGLWPYDGCYGDEVISEDCGKFSGLTVDEFLTLANKVVSGMTHLLNDYSATLSDMNYTATCLNELYSDCDPYAPVYTTSPDLSGSIDGSAKEFATEATEVLPEAYSLDQNHPNPFNPVTAINFSLPQSSHVRLQIFNILGQPIETLIDGNMEAGYHTITWNANGFASGLYLYRLQADDFIGTRKMILMK